MTPVIEYSQVSIDIPVDRVSVRVIDGVSFSIGPGEAFGLVGESGCGKTTLARAAIGLTPPGASFSGSVSFRGQLVQTMSSRDLRSLRGDRVGMIFQDPMSSLDPCFPVGDQIAETIAAHRKMTRKDRRRRAIELLKEVGIPEPEIRYSEPPHRFSGGMCQRVAIAISLANEPDVLIADEPTTALDVSVQAQILGLVRSLAARRGMSLLLISHDLGVIAQTCDRVGVMYAGQLVEVGPTRQVLQSPAHMYTRALLAATPRRGGDAQRLQAIGGHPPDPSARPEGCAFRDRCLHALGTCRTRPMLEVVSGGHVAACWVSAPAATDARVAATRVRDMRNGRPADGE